MIGLRPNSNKHRETALKFLQWLAFCARPPCIEGLAEVICVDFEADSRPCFCPDLRYDPESVLMICSSLIIMTSASNDVKNQPLLTTTLVLSLLWLERWNCLIWVLSSGFQCTSSQFSSRFTGPSRKVHFQHFQCASLAAEDNCHQRVTSRVATTGWTEPPAAHCRRQQRNRNGHLTVQRPSVDHVSPRYRRGLQVYA